MQPLNINFVIDRLKNLDPTKNSIDENLAPAPKMSFWEKWFVRILHFVTCGYYAKNAKLDEMTKKIVLCASEILPKEFEEEEQRQYINAFTILKNIDKENEGSEQDKIEQVITKIRASNLKKSVLPEKQPEQEPVPPFNPPTPPPRASSPLREPPPVPPQRVPSPPPVPHEPVVQPGASNSISTNQVLPLAEPQPVSDVQFTAEEILNQILMMRHDDKRLPPLADKLAADKAFTGDLICKHQSAVTTLLWACKDNFNFKVIIAEKLLLQRNSHQVLESHFSEDVWNEVARRWPLEEKVDPVRSPMNRKPEFIVAFANTLAMRADAQNEKIGAHLFDRLINNLLIQHVYLTHDLTLLKALSPQAVALANIKNLNWIHLFREKDALSVIHPFFKAFTEHEPSAYVVWMEINDHLPSEKCKLLPWKEYPRWLQIFLAQRAGQLEDVAYLRNVCKEMTKEDTDKFHAYLRNCNPFPDGLIKTLVDPTLIVQPPVVEKLIMIALAHPTYSIFIPPNVWDSLDVTQVNDRHVRQRLVNVLGASACRKALQAWENFNIFHFEPNNPPSLDKYLQAEEDPESLRGAFELLFGVEDVLGIRNGHRRRIPNSCKDTLAIMEETPWKLYAALYRSTTPVEDEWQKWVQEYPKAVGVVQSHAKFLKQKDELKDKLFVEKVDDQSDDQEYGMISHSQVLRSNPKWNEVYQEIILDEFFYAFLTHADPRSVALYLRADDELMMFLAILDETARENLIKARGTSPAFTRLREVAQMMAESDHLPAEAKQQAAEFIKKLNASMSIGGASCHLHKQYNNPAFADLKIKIGQEILQLHRAIVGLDPVLMNLLGPLPLKSDDICAVNPEQGNQVRLRLKCLYGALTPEERIDPDTKKIMQQMRDLSLTSLLNPPSGPGVVTLLAEDKIFRAHRFILAAGLPYFEAIFHSGMQEAAKKHIEIPEISASQLEAILYYTYADEKPDFADEASKQAFEVAFDRFKQTGAGISIVEAATKASQPKK